MMDWVSLFTGLMVTGSIGGHIPATENPPGRVYSGTWIGISQTGGQGVESGQSQRLLGGAIGMRNPFGLSNVRMEIEGARFSGIGEFQRYSNINITDANNYSFTRHNGLDIHGGFFNFYYEIPIFKTLRPYVGLGLGVLSAQSWRTDRERWHHTTNGSSFSGQSGGIDNQVSYRIAPQYIIGVEFDLPPFRRRHFSLGAEYRYMAVDFGFADVHTHTTLMKLTSRWGAPAGTK